MASGPACAVDVEQPWLVPARRSCPYASGETDLPSSTPSPDTRFRFSSISSGKQSRFLYCGTRQPRRGRQFQSLQVERPAFEMPLRERATAVTCSRQKIQPQWRKKTMIAGCRNRSEPRRISRRPLSGRCIIASLLLSVESIRGVLTSAHRLSRKRALGNQLS
jgi:hypothetical protein